MSQHCPPAQTDPKEVGRGAHRHCDCTRLCDMGPTCSLAPPDLPGAGCFRVQPYPPDRQAAPKHEHDGSGCIECPCNAAPWSADDCTCPGGFS